MRAQRELVGERPEVSAWTLCWFLSKHVGSLMDPCVNRRIIQEQRRRVLQRPKTKAAVKMSLR